MCLKAGHSPPFAERMSRRRLAETYSSFAVRFDGDVYRENELDRSY